MLFGTALQLPEPEADEHRDHRERKQAETEMSRVHFGARSIRRPSAALWWYCSAISSDFIERSGNSVVARIRGSQSTACSQNGGWYLISTISAAPTTIAPAIMIMKIAGPSPESMNAKSSPQDSQLGRKVRKPE